MTTSLSGSNTPEEVDGPTPAPKSKRWLYWIAGLLLAAVAGLAVVVGFGVNEGRDLVGQVRVLESKLATAERESAEAIAALAQERDRIAALQTTMGRINQLSTELAQNLAALDGLTAEALAVTGGQAVMPSVSAAAPPQVAAAPPHQDELVPAATDEMGTTDETTGSTTGEATDETDDETAGGTADDATYDMNYDAADDAADDVIDDELDLPALGTGLDQSLELEDEWLYPKGTL